MQAATREKRKVQDSLGYIRDGIGRPPRLTADEEKDLARKAKAGDGQARETMIRCNMPLAIKVLRGWAWGSSSHSEQYMGAAFEGLIKGVDLFDPDRGCRLTTYLTRSVRRHLTAVYRREGTLVRVPVYLHEALCRARSGKPVYRRTSAAIIDRAGHILAQQPCGHAGLDADPLADIVDPASFEDDGTPPGITPDRLMAAIARLPRRQADLIRERWFGDEDHRPTLLDIAGRVGVTKQAIQQSEQAAIAALREMLSAPEEVSDRTEGGVA